MVVLCNRGHRLQQEVPGLEAACADTDNQPQNTFLTRVPAATWPVRCQAQNLPQYSQKVVLPLNSAFCQVVTSQCPDHTLHAATDAR